MDFEEYFRKNFNDGLSEPSKHILRFTFESGQQSKQAEIDALKNKMQTTLNKACMLQNSSGERIYTELKELLK